MWTDFFLIAVVQLAMLVIPGCLLLRAFGLGRMHATVLGPIVSTTLICILCIAYSLVGIASNGITVLVPLLIFVVIAWLIGLARRRGKHASNDEGVRESWLSLVCYVAVGLLIGAFVFLVALGEPDNFIQRFDNYLHLNVIRGFVDAENMTVFGISPYYTEADAAISPYSAGGFYPSGWYILAALSLTLVPTTVVIAENALLYVFLCVVFPSGMYLLLARLGDGTKRFCVYGAVATMAFIAFPWNLFEFGPIYPNAAGLSLFPHVVLVFMDMVERGKPLSKRIVPGLAFLSGVFACAIIQPNVVFVLIIFLLPFVVKLLYRMGVPDGVAVSKSGKQKRNLVLCVALVVLVCVFWYALYLTPTFQNMKAYGWIAQKSHTEAFINILTLQSADAPPQFLLAAVVIVGSLYLLYKKKHRWLVVAYVIMAMMTFMGESVDRTIKYVLDTFCYSDTRRLWAFLAVFGMPIAAYGFVAIDEVARKLMDRIHVKLLGPIVSAIIVTVFCILNFTPQSFIMGQEQPDANPFDTVREMVRSASVGDEVALTPEERDFIEEVIDELPEGTLVMNLPTDGTMYAYGVSGIRTYYRVPSSFVTSGESESAETLRLHLDEVADNEDVQAVLRDLDMEYLLLLDVGGGDSNWKTIGDDPAVWPGVKDIDDMTPGFEVVLSSGDMRLYRIAY